jgi:diaminohydroxyphosphoribosylaminopyrimidine deaminase/5-amino-6-(5-phosphoribosylamino)uracil reductase
VIGNAVGVSTTPREPVGRRAGQNGAGSPDDRIWMGKAIELAHTARVETAPNPWVGAVLVSRDGQVRGVGATEPPGGRHAEIVALESAGPAAEGSTIFVTLEPCAHHGRTPPCIDALIVARVSRVVVGVEDPDPRVAGAGIAALRAAGIEVTVGIEQEAIEAQLEPYLVHRRTGRPLVVAKSAMTLDGRSAAPDGSSRWITGPEARADAHRIRAESGAIIVGSGTVRSDDPQLTVREANGRDPLRVVLGSAPEGARVHPCLEWAGSLDSLLDDLGGRHILQVLIEGGPTVLGAFHQAGLIDRYVVYLAPAIFGGNAALPMMQGTTPESMAGIWRGRLVDVQRVGDDVRVDIVPDRKRE